MSELNFDIQVVPGGLKPVKSTEEASCYDVYARQLIVDGEEGKVRVKLGFAGRIPKGYAVELVPRSGITKSRYVLQNSPGQIESDFRKEWEARFIGIPNIEHLQETNELKFEIGKFPYKPGERVAQIFFRPVLEVVFNEAEDILEEETARGEGFGSSGNAAIVDIDGNPL